MVGERIPACPTLQVERKFEELRVIRPHAEPHRDAPMEQRWALLVQQLLADDSVDRAKVRATACVT